VSTDKRRHHFLTANLAVTRTALSWLRNTIFARGEIVSPETEARDVGSRGGLHRDIQGHLEEMYGVEVSPSLTSDVTDGVMDAWGNRMLTNFDVEGILRDDLRRARERVQQTLASFLRIADQAGAGAPERLDQAAADHSVARDQVVAAIQRWNQFCQFGTVPEDLAVKAKRAGEVWCVGAPLLYDFVGACCGANLCRHGLRLPVTDLFNLPIG
jgi:hypothetical protein